MRSLVNATLLTLALATAVRAGLSADMAAAMSPRDTVCEAARVVVAKVANRDRSEGTRAQPPRVTVVVKKTLAGSGPPVLMERWVLEWKPEWHGVDWGGSDALQRIQRWGTAALVAPEIGSRWILAIPRNHGGRGLEPAYRFEYSKALLEQVRSDLAGCDGEVEDEEYDDDPYDDDEEDEDPVSDPDDAARGEWEKVLRGATGSLQRCPEEWIRNRMPGPAPTPGTAGPPREYFILDGSRREIAEFDGRWLAEHCHLEPMDVW